MAGIDVFISHAGRDRAWAEWVAHHLEEAHYSVELDVWDWAAGDNFVLRISDALERAAVMVALWSPAYFERDRYTTNEWTALLAAQGRLVPLCVEPVTPPAVLRPLVYANLAGLSASDARRVLLDAVGRRRSTPAAAPGYPGPTADAPRLPGALPEVWNIPVRSPAFVGRDGMLGRLREQLCDAGTAVVQALHGLGGVGKTALAIEYAHRFASTYTLAWWIDAERPELVGERVSALAVEAGWVPPATDVASAAGQVRRRLHERGGWLVVFDNAENPDDIAPWLPQGAGHVLVTSRNPRWEQLAEPIEVDAFVRAESVALLRRLAPALSDVDAGTVAARLEDLPLAVAQAGGLIGATGMPVASYLRALGEQAAEVLARGKPAGCPRPLAASVRLSMERLENEDPAAAQLMRLCAFLAPEPVPVEFLADTPDGCLPEPLATAAASTLALGDCVDHIGRYGLARIRPAGMQVHRLTQAVIAHSIPEELRQETRGRAEAFVVSAAPRDNVDPAHWPRWVALMPHLLAAAPSRGDSANLRDAANRATWFLVEYGDIAAAQRLAEQLHREWTRALGPDDSRTLRATHNLAHVYRATGRYQEAYDLDLDTHGRYRRLMGEDDPSTLASGTALALDLNRLGRYDEAHVLDKESLTRRRRDLGEDHPDTLVSANNLALDLRGLGRYDEAHAHDDTLTRKRRILGDDHPSTLTTAYNRAFTLFRLGRVAESAKLLDDTWTRKRRVLVEEHPSTRMTAAALKVVREALERERG